MTENTQEINQEIETPQSSNLPENTTETEVTNQEISETETNSNINNIDAETQSEPETEVETKAEENIVINEPEVETVNDEVEIIQKEEMIAEAIKSENKEKVEVANEVDEFAKEVTKIPKAQKKQLEKPTLQATNEDFDWNMDKEGFSS